MDDGEESGGELSTVQVLEGGNGVKTALFPSFCSVVERLSKRR